MRLTYAATGCHMSARELVRSRISIILLFAIPTLFYTLVALTTTERTVGFKLAAIAEEPVILVSERSQALVFMGLAAVGLLTSFLGMILVQRNTLAGKRLVLAGFHPRELIFSKLAMLAAIITLIGCYVAAMLYMFFTPSRITLVVLGFMLCGYAYGCYGLFVGSVVRQELEGILLIVLLANIDVGWLQNPLFYADAQNKAIIRHLPAYFPSQASMIAAFSELPVNRAMIGGLLYGSVLLAAALFINWRRMRIHR